MEICLNGYFNPRSHKGSDVDLTLSQAFFEVFQSTLPQGERRCVLEQLRSLSHFNPRSHKGSDSSEHSKLIFSPCISIHAPTRGATARKQVLLHHYGISIHAPTRGATALVRDLQKQSAISIHAPTRGATHLTELLDPFTVISIHAPTRGATESV